MEAKFQNVIVAHDNIMTVKERLECKVLVREAKEETEQESGDFVYRVRGHLGQMSIKKIRKRNETLITGIIKLTITMGIITIKLSKDAQVNLCIQKVFVSFKLLPIW